MGKLRQALLWLSAKSDEKLANDSSRKLTAVAAKLFRMPNIVENLKGFAEVAKFHETETASWVSPAALSEREGVPFDACDIRHWIEIAKMADVPFVDAREILALTESEMSALSGKVKLPEGRALTALAHGLQENADVVSKELESVVNLFVSESVNEDEAFERLYDAMDGVPEGWMVRFARTGGSELKVLAGAGVVADRTPEIRFSNDLEVGPGWVRNGNRRRVNVSDMRTVTAAAEGPGGDMTFIARPWVKAARYFVTNDPHRQNTPFQGKGVWPAEWRAFVEDGVVVGVSYYYGWTGEANQENAAIALEVREAAQRMVDVAMERQLWPRYMDVEHARRARNPRLAENEQFQEGMRIFGRETVSCTLDFIETAKGLMLLEGGPGASPMGGGHPCSFAGCGGKPTLGNCAQTNGVAFRNMPHVIVGDPKTWEDGDRTGCILTWDEVHELAMSTPALSL